jgi:glycyl-tRNA synthetase beta chain
VVRLAERHTFLLEIGVEELPARFCVPALEQLAAEGGRRLGEARLRFAASRVYGTPRRLAWSVEGLPARQEDGEVRVRGPARAQAWGPDGAPTRALEGFLRSQGAGPEDVVVEAVGGREYVFVRRREPGRPTAEVLAELVPSLVASLEFPRTMRWGAGDFRFARPIRWLVALLDDAVVPCEVAGVRAGRASRGHRTLHPEPVVLAHAAAYREALERAGVLVERGERRRRIAEGAEAAARAVGGRVPVQAELLEELTDINEWPTAFVGSFDPRALELPAAVLVTVMRVHQRYFPVEGPDGALLPHFVGIRNGGPEGLEVVVRGNERVLAARFADARFFYEEDLRVPLRDRVADLGRVAFAEGLGTLADKARRLEGLVRALAVPLGVDPEVVARAARLAKADRLTHLVYEFPELEGTMGAHYALRSGEPAEVADAIAEHVLPRGAEDRLPAGAAGRLLAVADRVDTLAGHFLLGRQPTGRADPLGLRRAAAAVVRILEAARWDLSLERLVDLALAGYRDLPQGRPAEAREALLAFLAGRLEARLVELGFRPDVVAAVLAAGADRVADAVARARAVQEALEGPGWADVVTAFKRAGHLARQGEPAAEVDPAAFEHPAEAALWEALQAARRQAEEAVGRGDPAGVLAATASLRQPVDAFLTEVLAMHPDPRVRGNRLALLAGVAAVPALVADLARLA